MTYIKPTIMFAARFILVVLVLAVMIAIVDGPLADPPRLYSSDGTYLGTLSSNPYDPESTSNPYGKYGNPHGNTINNPYREYGSPYSQESPNNPYAPSRPRWDR